MRDPAGNLVTDSARRLLDRRGWEASGHRQVLPPRRGSSPTRAAVRRQHQYQGSARLREARSVSLLQRRPSFRRRSGAREHLDGMEDRAEPHVIGRRAHRGDERPEGRGHHVPVRGYRGRVTAFGQGRRRKVLVVLSDGYDTRQRETLVAALEAAQRNDIVIYGISPAGAGDDQSPSGRIGASALRKLSDDTGGRALFPPIEEEPRTKRRRSTRSTSASSRNCRPSTSYVLLDHADGG